MVARESLLTDIRQAFQKHEIFLTGGNGFLGKVILGMIFDRYPEFKRLHILIRPRRNISAAERFYGEILATPALAPVVEKIARERGDEFLRRKITVWPGDIGEPQCGLEPAAPDELAGRVSVFVNCAGLVDFFPPVDVSFRSNVDGVGNVVALAKQTGAKLLHVSTCFVCGEVDGLIEETEPILGFYPRRKGPEDTSFRHSKEIQYARERMREIYASASREGEPGREASAGSREVVQRLTGLGKQRAENWGWVNTYTYAKSLGEQIIAAEENLDYAIVRPAIIESALRFPFPGWIEGGRTAAPLVLMALGGMRDWPVRPDTPLEVVPVDLVASAVLVVTALLLEGRHERVYQLGSADINPILLEPLVKLLARESRRRGGNGNRPAALALIDPPGGVRFLSSEGARARRERLQKRIDRAQALIGRCRALLEKTGMPGKASLAAWTTALRTLSLQASFREQTLEQYLPFILHNRHIFESENIRAAYSLLSARDQELLPWDPERIDWEDYWVNHQIEGIKKWIQPEAVKGWTFKI